MTIRKSKNILFNIRKPDVFKMPTSDTYVIFGEAKIEDLSHLQARAQLEQLRMAQQAAQQQVAAGVNAPSTDAGDADEGDVDESGLDSKDIELIMQQASVSRPKAVRALRKADGEIVQAIMDLTM